MRSSICVSLEFWDHFLCSVVIMRYSPSSVLGYGSCSLQHPRFPLEMRCIWTHPSTVQILSRIYAWNMSRSLSCKSTCLWQRCWSFWGGPFVNEEFQTIPRKYSTFQLSIKKQTIYGQICEELRHHLLLPCQSCGRTRPEHDSWTAPCSRRWHCSGPGDTEPLTCRSWPAHPGTHAAPGKGASWVGRRTRPALKALILALEYYSNQIRGTGFLDPEWQASVAIPGE